MDLLRETAFGKIIYYTSGRRYLKHLDEHDSSTIPTYIDRTASGNLARWGSITSRTDIQYTDGTSCFDFNPTINLASGAAVHPEKGRDLYLVTSSKNDPEDPRNWSTFKKNLVLVELCFYTASIYIGASLWSSSVDDVSKVFSVPRVTAQLGTSLFLFGLGFGPMIFSPLSEIPSIGSTGIYVLSALLFVACQLPVVLSHGLSVILVFRFITGVLASPCLSLGGASVKAMYSAREQGIPMAIWDTATAVGTFTGPVIGNYAAMYRGYTWPMWISLWSSIASSVSVICVLPETNQANILYRRARRLRNMTGNKKFISAAELHYSTLSTAGMIKDAIIKPATLSFTEPIVLVLNLYLALVYALLFAALESYDVVFVEIYGFTPGQEGLTFLGALFGFLLSLIIYVVFYRCYQQHRFTPEDKIKPEQRVIPSFVSAVTVPVGLFWFGWGARKDLHWLVPVIGGSFIGPSTAGLFFSIMNYLPDAYPAVSSTVLAGNNFIRAMLAGALPLFITPMYESLGPGWASSIWALLGCTFAPAPFVLYLYGDRIRLKSRKARHDF